MILTRVLLPAPFSPSRARTEPPMASRSTPWSTSTPPKDLRISLARRAKAMGVVPSGWVRSTGRRLGVDRPDVVLVDDLVLREDVLRDVLALELLHHVRDQQRAVALRVVGHRRDVVGIAGDVLPGGRIGALAGVVEVLLAAEGVGRADGAEDSVLVDRDDDDPVARERAEEVGHLRERGIGAVSAVEDVLLVGRDRAVLLEALTEAAHAVRVRLAGGRGLERHVGGDVAVPVVLRVLADRAAGHLASLAVVGTHEGDLARRLDDVDRDRRQVAVRVADLLARVLEDLEVQDSLDALDLQVLRAGERLGGVDLGVAE